MLVINNKIFDRLIHLWWMQIACFYIKKISYIICNTYNSLKINIIAGDGKKYPYLIIDSRLGPIFKWYSSLRTVCHCKNSFLKWYICVVDLDMKKCKYIKFNRYKKVFIWGGQYLKQLQHINKYLPKEKTVFAELGFFADRNGKFYLDNRGPNGSSEIRDAHLPILNKDDEEFINNWKIQQIEKNIQEEVKFNDYIFVPLQLEADSNFLTFQHNFTSNQEFINFIEECFPNNFIVFKIHPRNNEEWNVKQSPTAAVYRLSNKNNILLSPNERNLYGWIRNAKCVITINSTVAIESLLFNKPVATLGETVITNHNVFLECHEDKNRVKQILNCEVNEMKINGILFFLFQKQISFNNPEIDRVAPFLGIGA